MKHVEIGLTDKSDSARWAAQWLAQRGINGGLVLIGGDEFGPIGGVAGSDSMMMVEEFARGVVVSFGVEPEGVPAGVVHRGSGPDGFLELLDGQLARRSARRRAERLAAGAGHRPRSDLGRPVGLDTCHGAGRRVARHARQRFRRHP